MFYVTSVADYGKHSSHKQKIDPQPEPIHARNMQPLVNNPPIGLSGHYFWPHATGNRYFI